MSPKTRNLIEINLAALLWGGTALFAKLIELPVGHIIFGRSLMAALALALFLRLTGRRLALRSVRDAGMLALTGALMGAHWLTYFQAIKVSSVAVGIIAIHTYPILTILLEPLFRRERLQWTDGALGVAVLAGVAILVPEFHLRSALGRGVLWGVVSAVFFALRNLLTRPYARRYPGSLVLFYQVLVITVLLLPYALGHPARASNAAFSRMVLLGVVFTALPHALFTSGHAHLKAKTASLVAALLPVYGSLLAVWVLGEIPAVRTVVGGLIVVGVVVVETVRSLRSDRKSPPPPEAPAVW
jgi:drug/metabolite transporter (DMT)-like permease